jgi:predicted small secreted protein
MKKTIAISLLVLFGVALISSCGTRRGDKCPGVGQVEKTVKHV